MTRRVWVLGAGFSRSLGGPLLADLLTPESQHALEVKYGDAPKLRNPACNLARTLYWFGARSRRPGLLVQGEEHHWDDPEDYLDQLDAAASSGEGSPSFRRLDEIRNRAWVLNFDPAAKTSPTLEDTRNAARRILAAECSSFLVGADTTSERWAPYLRWMARLNHNDAVITFNYDRVVERLAEASRVPLHVYVSGGERFSTFGPSLLKMHGSVDWKRFTHSEGVRFQKVDDPDFCVNCEDRAMAIASPGPSKARSVEELKAIWDLALTELEQADYVTFVGYRFPPTDANARDQLLDAMRRRGASALVTTVLGPNLNHPDPARLAGLVEVATRREPRRLPLFAQDFLGISEWLVPKV